MSSKLILAVFCVLTVLNGSSQDVELEKVEDGHRIELYVVNNSEQPQSVTVDLFLEEVEANRDIPITEVIPPNARVRLVTLTPEPLKAWSYKTRFKHEVYDASNFDQSDITELDDADTEESETTTVTGKPKPFEVPAKASVSRSDAQLIKEASTKTKPSSTGDEGTNDLTSHSKSTGIKAPPQNTDDAPMPRRYNVSETRSQKQL